MRSDYDVIVIGAGPAGLMAAGRAAERGLRVLIVERNERPGRKLLITGKGRCNVTNDCTVEEFLTAVRGNSRFLYSAANALSPTDTMAFFEDRGLRLKTERGKRVFPASDRSADVLAALVGYCDENHVHIETGRVTAVVAADGHIAGVRLKSGAHIEAPAVILATGGLSYPTTGSDGTGYRLAREVGHTVTETRPSLIPINTAEGWCAEAAGLSLRNVVLSLKKADKLIFSEIGEMLFTHFGVSGPLVLSASSHMKEEPTQYRLWIDLKPGLDVDRIDKRLLRDFEANANRDFANSLGDLLPKSLIPVMVRLSGIPGDLKVHQMTREQRRAFGGLLKALPLTPTGFRPIAEAVITAGGIALDEVNPRTMESKLVAGLYFAGEVLNLDAYTGGFNLQIAFSTGYAAGSHAGGN